MDWVDWVTPVPSLSTYQSPNNIDHHLLREPKLEIDGSVFTGSSYFPQSNGQPSRVTALNWCIRQGNTNYAQNITIQIMEMVQYPLI